jgi:hypothetical protein
MAMKHGGEDVVDEYCVEVEVELDDEDLIPSSYLAMARLYLGKRFNERGLFEEMWISWGLAQLAAPNVLGDNKYLLEFDSEEVRDRVVNGGPWWHKGDALILVAVDEYVRSSEVDIEYINMWAHFYDLPKALMKEQFALKLGVSLGQVLRVDTSFPTYLRGESAVSDLQGVGTRN